MNEDLKPSWITQLKNKWKLRRVTYRPYSYVFSLLITLSILSIFTYFMITLQSTLFIKELPSSLSTKIVISSADQINDTIKSSISNNGGLSIPVNVIVTSPDLETVVSDIKSYIDQSLDFLFVVLALVVTIVGVVVPLYNHFFYGKELMDSSKKFIRTMAIKHNGVMKGYRDLMDAYQRSNERATQLTQKIDQLEEGLNMKTELLSNRVNHIEEQSVKIGDDLKTSNAEPNRYNQNIVATPQLQKTQGENSIN